MAMTRPLPFGCIKLEKKAPKIDEVRQLLKSITLEEKIGHIFTVDIEFSDVNPKALLFNEVYPPIFEKKKKEPTAFKIMFSNNEQGSKKKRQKRKH